jgi:hypothetical protein
MVNLMTRDEMLERLNKGEDPWEIVFDKWNRIKRIYLVYGKIDLPISIFGETCVLCEVHSTSNAAIYCHGYEHGTLPCPLVQIGERCGSKEGNAWGEFAKNPSIETTRTMIGILRRAKKGTLNN